MKVAVLFAIFLVPVLAKIPYKELYFDQYLDHFNFNSYGNKTFKQRYLINDRSWSRGKGPIFFYTGNEGDITNFWDNTGFVFDIAPSFRALVIFAEHRYYGKSLPFGNSSFDIPNVGLLTIEQALADYAVLLQYLKPKLGATQCPVIAFGGSYGGMLAGYMRFKYPSVIDGALAASAPVYMIAGLAPRNTFFADVTKDFRNVDPKCEAKVREAFSTADTLAKAGKKGLASLSAIFKLCQPMTSVGDYRHLLGWARNAFVMFAMMDYPYPTSFMGKMPANPVKVACKSILAAPTPLAGLASALGIFYNATLDAKCYNIWDEFVECADPTGCGLGFDSLAWDYQACTEMILPEGSNNVTDMFPVLSFTLEQRDLYCEKRWKVVPRNTWLAAQMFTNGLHGASNIIFSNGNLDPWTSGGVLTNISSSLVSLLVDGGAHHLDLRAHNDADPPSVINVRKTEVKLIQTFINQARRNFYREQGSNDL